MKGADAKPQAVLPGPPPQKKGKTPDANRLTYLDENNPWYPHRDFPKLITPQWVGEEGVECVVILAIDDMREPAKYEKFLRPILDRLKKIDGRAPVSIMTCNVKPDDPQLAQWLGEGLSLEVHTVDHPCPLLAGGDLAKAKSTYDRCVDLMNEIPGNKPVAFRMPCCDSLNTVSPRFYSEIFNKTTPKGNFLAIDSSVFNLFSANDPAIPRELVIDADGREKFRKYLPKNLKRGDAVFNTFVNFIEDYPYPYVINRLCWEFPCVVPSDWSAQHLQKPNNPDTVRDLKAALDITVLKQGVYCLVFHPHDWIRNDQLVELIDHAVAKHGKKVKFLNFREALERLNKYVLRGNPVRQARPLIGDAELVDLDHDGFQDVVFSIEFEDALRDQSPPTRAWMPKSNRWDDTLYDATRVTSRFTNEASLPERLAAGVVHSDGRATLVRIFTFADHPPYSKTFSDGQWAPNLAHLRLSGHPGYYELRDLDGDGRTEFIYDSSEDSFVLFWSEKERSWKPSPFKLPNRVRLTGSEHLDAGLRFVDIDKDGHDDLVFSNSERYGVYLFENMQTGWSRVALEGVRGSKDREPQGTNDATPPGPPLQRGGGADAKSAIRNPKSPIVLPPIVRADGSDNGFFVHSRSLYWHNEDTDRLPDLVDRVAFNDILAQANLPPKAKSPDASLKSIRVRPGFTVELVAAEPLTMDPVAFAFGPDGKLWIAEMGDYPLGVSKNEPAGGRIRFLEDTDSDGRYDKSTLFLEIPFPAGVLPWKKGILVSAAPNVLYAEDSDGDGRADKTEILYRGFVEGNQQHRVNGLVWGLDNWIYLANGDSGGTIESMKTGRRVSINGRDLRIRPETGDLDPVTGQTQFGRNCDNWGNWFGCNNSNPMYHFVLDDRFQRRNPHFYGPAPRVDVPEVAGNAPVFPISVLQARFNDFHTANRFTSACSAIVYRDELFGPHFANSAFISEPVHNLVHREVMSPKGVTFTSRRAADEEQSEFLASSDNWFRPTMIQTGPDGALWIADMYRQVIEHPQWIPDTWQRRLDLRAGRDKGRIYRVYPLDAKPRAIPRLDKLDTVGLIAALDSPSGWQRDTAQRLLVERRDKSAIVPLEKQARESNNALCRLHSLCTLDGLEALSGRALIAALDDAHPALRRHAARLCASFADRANNELVAALARSATDDDAQVRLQVAYTLGEINHEAAGRVLGECVAREAEDTYLLSAAMSSVNKPNLHSVLAGVLAGNSGRAANPALLDQVLRLAAAFRDDKALTQALGKVVRPQKDRYEAWQFAALAGLLDALDRQQTPLAAILADAKRSAAATDRDEIERGVKRLFEAARQLAGDDRAETAPRVAAVAVLGRGLDGLDADLDRLAALLAPQTQPELQSAAVTALGRLRAPRVAGLLVDAWRGFGPARRAQALDVLLAREPWQQRLFEAIERQEIAATDVDAARRQRLLEHQSLRVRQQAAKLFGGGADADRQKVVEQYRPALDLAGDARHGGEKFAKVCAQCHKLGSVGHEVGPDLNSLTDKSPEALLVAVLDPNRAVESKFLSYTALTRAGLTVTGLLASETGNGITLLGPEGKEQTILRADLEELAGTSKSTMPEGLEKDLAPQDLADVIAYVRANVSLPARKTFDGNQPELIKPAADGSLLLTAAACEIYGATLVFEKPHGNLGWWSSLDDHAVWTIEVTRGGKYAVEFEYACDPSVAKINDWRLEAGGESLVGQVPATANWDAYKQAMMGEIALARGRQRVTLVPAKRIQGALIDLKAIRLTPK